MTDNEYNDAINLKEFENLLERYSVALLNGDKEAEEMYYGKIVSQYISASATIIKRALGNERVERGEIG